MNEKTEPKTYETLNDVLVALNKGEIEVATAQELIANLKANQYRIRISEGGKVQLWGGLFAGDRKQPVFLSKDQVFKLLESPLRTEVLEFTRKHEAEIDAASKAAAEAKKKKEEGEQAQAA